MVHLTPPRRRALAETRNHDGRPGDLTSLIGRTTPQTQRDLSTLETRARHPTQRSATAIGHIRPIVASEALNAVPISCDDHVREGRWAAPAFGTGGGLGRAVRRGLAPLAEPVTHEPGSLADRGRRHLDQRRRSGSALQGASHRLLAVDDGKDTLFVRGQRYGQGELLVAEHLVRIRGRRHDLGVVAILRVRPGEFLLSQQRREDRRSPSGGLACFGRLPAFEPQRAILARGARPVVSSVMRFVVIGLLLMYSGFFRVP